MSENPEKKHVAAHVPMAQYRVWKREADAMDESMSTWVQMMTSAGRKKFDRSGLTPDETRIELREQRNDYRDALRDARERINKLERERSASERRAIIEYVEKNPGADKGEILQHVVNTTNGRVSTLLTELEGVEVRVDDEGRFYAGERRNSEVSDD